MTENKLQRTGLLVLNENKAMAINLAVGDYESIVKITWTMTTY
jgi:hypothetical protein